MTAVFSNPFNEPKKSILLKNARIFDESQGLDIKSGFLAINNGLIDDFGENCPSEAGFDRVIDCKGLLLTAGLIDMQVHFRDPGQTHKEDLISGSKAAVSGGITSVVCQPNTSPTIDSVFNLFYLKSKAKEAFCRINVYPSITKGLKGDELSDMYEMAKEGMVVGFTDDGLPVMNAYFMRQAFEISAVTGKLIAQHAEDHNLSHKGCINEGKVSAGLGVRGIPSISESVIVARDIEILRYTGGRYHVLHVSAAETVDLIRKAKAEGLKITAEAAPHHFLLTDEAVYEHGTNAKMNPPLRSEKDRMAVIAGLKDGTIDAIATDHAPHDVESKRKTLNEASFGIVGVETMLPLSLELWRKYNFSLGDIIKKMTYNPAKILGLNGGKISKNSPADLTLIDLDYEWELNANTTYSKCLNTPFLNQKLKGKAVLTLVDGVVVYKIPEIFS